MGLKTCRANILDCHRHRKTGQWVESYGPPQIPGEIILDLELNSVLHMLAQSSAEWLGDLVLWEWEIACAGVNQGPGQGYPCINMYVDMRENVPHSMA